MLPFTETQFLKVFVAYNEAIWPAQIVAYLLGLACTILLLRPSALADRISTGILALMWIWTGVAYHWLAFTQINAAAYMFGALFVVQGFYFGYIGIVRDGLAFGFRSNPASWTGLAFVIYAALLYPVVGAAFGHKYPEMPMFGVTPCPVTIFTFGMLLMTTRAFTRGLLIIPVVWSLVGGSAAILLNVPQDWVLLLSGAITLLLLVLRDRAPVAAVERA